MADPLAQGLLDACETNLATILVANGFRTDAGEVVTTEPQQLIDNADVALGLCVYLDGLERPTDPSMRTHGWRANLMVIGKRKVEVDARQAGQVELLEDIERAMAPRRGWPVGMTAPVFEEAKFINRAEGLPWVGVVVRYSAHIARPRA